MLYMLRGGMEEPGGTSQALWAYDLWQKGNQIGGKTGTTSNYSDGWYIGVTKDLVTGVWVGASDRHVHFRNGANGEGSRTALPIFGKFMEKVYDDNSTRSEEHTSELQSLMRISYAVFCLKKNNTIKEH